MERGGARWLGLRIGLAGVFVVGPTSLIRGEGLVVGLLRVIERVVWW